MFRFQERYVPVSWKIGVCMCVCSWNRKRLIMVNGKDFLHYGKFIDWSAEQYRPIYILLFSYLFLMEPESGTLCRIGNVPVDTTVLSLIAVNLFLIVFALFEGWSLATVIFIYWFQSLIIGFFTVLTLLSLNENDLMSWTAASDPSGESTARFAGYGRYLIAGFFALHYGLFHFGYYTFLIDFGFSGQLSPWTNPDVLIACGLFFLNHLYSFLYYRKRDQKPHDATYLKEVFTTPYYRIIPMHITIMAAGFTSIIFYAAGFDSTPLLLVLFLCLKTYVDVRMHLAKHGELVAGGACILKSSG